MSIVRPEDWRFNPLQCFLKDPAQFLVLCVNFFARILHLPERARLMLSEFLYRLYDRFGVWAGQCVYPTLYDLVEEVRRSVSVNAAAKEALLHRLISLLLTMKPSQVAYRRGWNPIDLSDYHIDWEMRGATESQKHLFLSWLLVTIFNEKIERGLANSGLSLLVAMDDAQRFVSLQGSDDSHDFAPIAELATVIRSPGIGLCFDIHTLTACSPPLLATLRNKFFGGLGTGTDYASMGAQISLSSEQIDFVNHHAKPGWFVGQVAAAESREPIFFHVPLLPELPPVTDDEAALSCAPLKGLSVEPAPEFSNWQPFPTIEVNTPAVEKAQGVSPLALDVISLRFLREVVSQPGQSSSAYARAAGLNGQKAAKIRAELVAAGYLREHSVALGTRGRTSIVLEPLPRAYQILGQIPPEEAK